MSERWMPENGEGYWCVLDTTPMQTAWCSSQYDFARHNAGNVFKTHDQALIASIKIKSLLLSLHDNGTSTDSETLKDTFTEYLKKCAEIQADMILRKAREHRLSEQYGNAPEETKLPKLTAEVFNRPDCPAWAKYAAVDQDGAGSYFESEPAVLSWCPWWDRTIKHCLIDNLEKWDASDWQNSLVERPAKLPEWCKVGEWCFCLDDDGNCKYFKITKIKGNFIYGEDWDIDYHFIRQARLRPYNAEEMKALMGKVIEKGPSMHIVTGFENVFDNECMVHVNGCLYAANDLLRQFTIDNAPCGVLEHLENGEWVN